MTEVEAEVATCGAQASSCACDRPRGHDTELPHSCQCGGQWVGDWDTDSFWPVKWPEVVL